MRSNWMLKTSASLLILGFGFACTADTGASEGGGPVGPSVLKAALVAELGDKDVTGVAYTIVAATATCAAGTPIESGIAGLLEQAFPANLGPMGTGNNHPFAAALFVLPPGSYRVCATPLAGTMPSADCGATEAVANVIESMTSEVVLVSQCQAVDSGALGASTVLNDPPVIEDLGFTPSYFITTCESVTIEADASDPNGDDVSYVWSQVTGPVTGTLTPGMGVLDFLAAFETDTVGDYQLLVTVTDALGGVASLQFPIHVTECNP